MTDEELKKAWLKTIRRANERGIPLPLFRDNKTGYGSASLTLMWISFGIWVMSVIGKVAGVFGGINPDQCLSMFYACAGLYFGRKFQKDGNKITLDEKAPEPKAEEK